MPKTYSINLGSATERELRYSQKDREEFEERFGEGMWTTIKRHVLALNEDDEPTPGGMLKAQRALLWFGLRHAGKKVTEEAVGQWLTDAVAKGENVLGLYQTATAAVLESGVLGFRPAVEEEEDPKDSNSTTEQ